MPSNNLEVTAFFYYDDSPTYGTALIFGMDTKLVEDIADEYHAERLSEIEEAQSIYSECRLIPITNLATFNLHINEVDEVIDVDADY